MYENCNYFKDKFKNVYFLYADTLVLDLYFVVAMIIYIRLKMQLNKNKCSKRGR